AGEAGIGTSTLVRAFADRVRGSGGRLLTGACLPLGTGDLPYGPIVEAFRGLIRTLAPGEIPAIFGPDRGEFSRLLPELRVKTAGGPTAASGAGAAGTAPAADSATATDSADRYPQVRLF